MTTGSTLLAGRTALVIPCFNEAARLRTDEIEVLLKLTDARIVFVDDGSTDDTARLVGELVAAAPERLTLLRLLANRGKAEAVRRGLLQAIRGGARIAGYADADFATPAAEVARLVETVDRGPVEVVMACRVARLGARIERPAVRHYGGRVFGTLASLALRMTVYDTQCGAKVFRVSDDLPAVLATPFKSRWAFDVELLDRLRWNADGSTRLHPDQFLEVPLQSWRHIGGSKLDARGSANAIASVLQLMWRRRSTTDRSATDRR